MTSGELPFNWLNVELGDVSDACLGKMLDQAKHRSGMSLPYLRNINVRWGYFDLDDVAEMYFDESELEKYALYPGDLMVCEGGEPGRCAIWRQEGSTIKFQKALHRVRPHACLLPEWAMYSLLTDARFQRLAEYFTGTTIKHLTGRSLARYQILLPPLNEQRRIVAKLDELFTRTRKVRQTLESIPPLLDKLRQSILAAAFRGDLTAEWRAQNPDVEPASMLLERIRQERRQKWEADLRAKGKDPAKAKFEEPGPVDGSELPQLPEGWGWIRVSEAGSVQLGRQRAPQHHQGEHMRPYLRTANVYEDRIDLSDVLEMNFTPEEFETYRLTSGDILLNEGQSRELVGRPAMYRGELPGACFQNTLVRFQAGPAVLPEFALAVFRHYLRSGRFMTIAQWSTNIAHLGAGRFAQLEFPLPPFAEQEAVILTCNKALANVENTALMVKAASEAVSKLEQSILAKAFRGELVPQDPNDEPASVLLERIRAERAAAEPAKRGRKANAAAGSDMEGAPKRRGRSKKAAVVEPVFADQELPETGMEEIARQLQELERQEALLQAALEAKRE